MSRQNKIERAKEELIQKYLEETKVDRNIDVVEQALERALEDTTPERAGSPWKNKPKAEPESEWFDGG